MIQETPKKRECARQTVFSAGEFKLTKKTRKEKNTFKTGPTNTNKAQNYSQMPPNHSFQVKKSQSGNFRIDDKQRTNKKTKKIRGPRDALKIKPMHTGRLKTRKKHPN
jgi:hypothetical protein